VFPSISVVLDEVRRRLDFQFELLDSHNFKASIVLGTSSVVITILLAALALSQSQLSSLLTAIEYRIILSALILIAVLVLFVSIVLSVIVLWVRDYNRTPSIEWLRDNYMSKPAETTMEQLIENFIDTINKNEKTVKGQASLIKTATASLCIGLFIFICLLAWFILIFLKVIVL